MSPTLTAQQIKTCLESDPSEIVDSWINGNIGWVMNVLWACPPHVAAQVVLRLCADGRTDDANRITNRLIDRWIEDRDAYFRRYPDA